jgi:uncharacterized lipoprotein YddW (UPF0748 family)
MRGVWLAGVGGDSVFSTAAIRETVDRCKRLGINTIFVVTWNKGVTLYPSEIMRRETGVAIDPRLEGRDPLRELIEMAHRAGIQVHAWFEFGFSCSYQQPDGGPLIRRHPDWAALDVDGKLVQRNGFQWMNAFDPKVQEFMLAIITEVVENYDVDGVQGDDRLPALPHTAGYDPYTVALYQSEHAGASPPRDPNDANWVQWRADKLSMFVKRMYQDIKALDPELCISWAPSVWPWSRDNYLQDWPRWAREGWGDLFCPQIYRRDLAEYRMELEKVKRQIPVELHAKVAPGVLIGLANRYQPPSEQVRRMVEINRELGFAGEVFFYHQGLKSHGEVIRSLYVDEPAVSSP